MASLNERKVKRNRGSKAGAKPVAIHPGTGGRPRKSDPSALTEAMVRVLAAKELDPSMTLVEGARQAGIQVHAIKKWFQLAKSKPDCHNFVTRWNAVEAVFSGTGIPDPGDFETWRARYMDLEVLNPITQRKQNIGTTYPYMKPFIKALGDSSVTRMCCLWPVRHAKTAIIEQYVVYQLCKNPNARILIFCSNLANAKERIYAIQQYLTDEHLFGELHKTWGPWISKSDHSDKPWTQTSFYVRGRADAERSPSVRAVGIGTKIYGARADLIILDDVDDVANTPETRRKILQSINGPVLTRLTEGGKMVFIATRVGWDDIPGHLLNRPEWWVDIQSALSADGTPLEEEMYSKAELDMIAQDMTPEEFSMYLLNDPAPEGSMMFPPDLVNTCKVNRDNWPEDWDYYIGIDPAPAQHTGLVVVAKNRTTGEMAVVDAESRKGAGYQGLMESLTALIYRYRPRWVIIEEQGGSMVYSDVPHFSKFIHDEGASLVRFKTGQNKHDPRFGVSLVADKMRAQKLVLAWGDATRHRLKTLEQEMLTYRPGPSRTSSGHHWDCLMALWFCMNIIARGPERGNRRQPIIDPLLARRPWLNRTRV